MKTKKHRWKTRKLSNPYLFSVFHEGYCIFDEPFDKKYRISKKGKINRKVVEV